MVLGLSRRPKGETDRISRFHLFRRFPLGNPLCRLRKTDLTDNLHFNPSAEPTPQLSIVNCQLSILSVRGQRPQQRQQRILQFHHFPGAPIPA